MQAQKEICYTSEKLLNEKTETQCTQKPPGNPQKKLRTDYNSDVIKEEIDFVSELQKNCINTSWQLVLSRRHLEWINKFILPSGHSCT